MQVLPRRGTAATWASSNPTLAPGEFGYETDTKKAKRGDGTTAWNDLPYDAASGGSNLPTPTQIGLGNVDNTRDVNKPLSTATSTALALKQNKLPTGGTTSQYLDGTYSLQSFPAPAAVTPASIGLGNVNNTSDAAKPISTAAQTALNAKQATLPTGAASQYLGGDLALHSLTSAALTDITGIGSALITAANAAAVASAAGLGNVSNTADSAKPISTAVATALSGKEPTIAAGTSGQYWDGTKTWQPLTPAAVGLANVTNTSDAAKPVSTATAAALATKQASLPTGGTTSQFLDGTYALQTLPVAATATSVGLGNVTNTSDANKPVSTAQQNALNLKANQTDLTTTNSNVTALSTNLANNYLTNTAFTNYMNPVLANINTALANTEPKITPQATGTYFDGTKVFLPLNAAAVGLGNVANITEATRAAAATTLTNKTIDYNANTILNLPSSGTGTVTVTPSQTIDFGLQQAELAMGPTFATGYGSATVAKIVDGIRVLGGKRVRIAVWWAAFETTTKGVYNFTNLDVAVNACATYGVTPLLCITSPMPTFYSPTATDYANFCTAVAARYGQQGTKKVKHYEIWNEPNLAAGAVTGAFTVANFSTWLKAASVAIRAADTGAFIITGGTGAGTPTNASQIDPVEWITGLYTNGCASYFDAVGYHYYSTDGANGTVLEPLDTGPFYTRLVASRAVMATYNDTAKTIWITEMGFPVPQVSFSVAAKYLAEQINLITLLPYVQTFIILGYQQATDNPPYGIVDVNFNKLQPLWDTVHSINASATVPFSVPELVTSSSTPIYTIGSDAGVGASVTVATGGTQLSHRVTVTTGTNPVNGGLFATTPLANYLYPPQAQLSPANTYAAITGFTKTTTTSLLAITALGEVQPFTPYVFDVFIAGSQYFDVTAPAALTAAPTVNSFAATTASVTVPATTDDVGVAGYNFYFNGVKNNSTPYGGAGPATYSAIQLHPATAYSVTVTAIDNAGNESTPSPAATFTTTAALSVAFDAVGTPWVSNTTGNTITGTCTHVVGAGADGLLEVILAPNTGGLWTNIAAYSAISVTSNIDGPLTIRQQINSGVSSQSTGSVSVFEKVRPTPGTHTLTFSVTNPNTAFNGSLFDSISYLNVGSSAVTVIANSGGGLNGTAASQVGGRVLLIGSFSSTPTAFNQTQRALVGPVSGGPATQTLLLGDAPGAASVNFTTTNNYSTGAILLSLNKAT